MRNENSKIFYLVGSYSALRYKPESREFDYRLGH